jgi:hypothetical protein
MANSDGVNRSHYEKMAVQPIVFIRANKLPWDVGEIIKYVCRWESKDGVKDLQKARDIIDRMIEDAQPQDVNQFLNRGPGLSWLDPWPKIEQVNYRGQNESK